MNSRQITHTAFLACIMMAAYYSFSGVLYLEAITFTTMVIAFCFPLRESFLASVIFGLLVIMFQGLFPWTLMYVLIFPVYTWIVYGCKNLLKKMPLLPVVLGFILSFLLGQLIDLPFLLFSKEVTYLYWILGLKTSLIQGFISACLTAFLFDAVCKRIKKIIGE